MKNTKNIEGVKKSNNFRALGNNGLAKHRFLAVDGIVRGKPRRTEAKIATRSFFVAQKKTRVKEQFPGLFLKKIYSQKRVPVLVVVVALLIAFGGGMLSVLDTKKSEAEVPPEVLGAFTDQPSGTSTIAQAEPTGNPVSGPELQNQITGDISGNALFNTPIQYLENYFKSASEPEVINKRKILLEKFLDDRHSPLAMAAETIAQQEHWKLILAITFAESTLGKNCSDFNCSNIGVKPGHPSWRQYSSYSAWLADFNRLLDKRYNDWTLEQMCGVYVKPCNPNWLLATQQILTALKEDNIE